MYGPADGRMFKKARSAFIKSLAGYSLFCFILQVKDRHNGNILIDREGHLVHIDFGFLLSNSPGKGINFEQAPFKLTEDFVRIMGGIHSKSFKKFRKLCVSGFIALRKRSEKIMLIIDMTRIGSGGNFSCFTGSEVMEDLRGRFHPFPAMNKRD